jgi:hypothetical protein
MASGSLRCGSFQTRPNGWIFPLKHADMALDPFDGNEDVILGGRSCPGSSIGQVVKVRLRDGKVTALTNPNNESDIYHVSARNLARPGWVYVSYFKEPGRRFSDEAVAVKLDGSGAVERYAHLHSAVSDCYRCEAHPVPSPDGRRVLFASNWAQDCVVGCGSPTDIKDYIASNTNPAVLAVEPPRPPPAKLAIEQVMPNPSTSLPRVVYSLVTWGPASLELMDIAGRRVLKRDLGSPGPGRHEARLGPQGLPALGVYWLLLSQGVSIAVAKLVLVR